MDIDYTQIATGLANLGGDLYGQYNKDKTADRLSQFMRDREKRNYEQYQNEYNAFLNSQTPGGGGGGGGRGGKGGKQKDPAKLFRKRHKKAMNFLRPWMESGQSLLPDVNLTYRTGLNNLQGLSSAYNPMQVVQQSRQVATPAQTKMQLPDYLK